MSHYIGDNFQAFDGSPIEVEFEIDKEISRALFVINKGTIVKEFLNPVSPLLVYLDEKDTKKLSTNNVAHLIVYDSEGRKQTCDGCLEFTVKKEIYSEG